eukprot:TRINITY_DN1158_c0_g1_i2.p1 TRINITY_DN1158_c0_g1~~TRINITY_DN1158_c0_g1_i2.p1  ORF type:complete len:196 (+),score=21.64 TRINITY_DN1158_c0_g1_i2:244-831(+)
MDQIINKILGYPPVDLVEYRDYVYSIGGAKGAFTLPNILKEHYNANVVGSASSWTWPLTKGAWLDAGVSMAKVQDTHAQVDYLVNEMKTTYKDEINFENDWKLLTFFIGANNICVSCKGRYPPSYFEKELDQVLSEIEEKIPRVFVNLVSIFNISGVWNAGQTKEYCKILWEVDTSECPCLTTGHTSDRNIMGMI